MNYPSLPWAQVEPGFRRHPQLQVGEAGHNRPVIQNLSITKVFSKILETGEISWEFSFALHLVLLHNLESCKACITKLCLNNSNNGPYNDIVPQLLCNKKI